jgi:hypothetical protein
LKDDEPRAAISKRGLSLARSRKVEFGTLYQTLLTTIPRNFGQRSDAARDANKLH